VARVRCPICRHVQDDPPSVFACAGCGRRLRWLTPQGWWPAQQALFESSGWQQEELPMSGPVARPQAKAGQRPAAVPPIGSAAEDGSVSLPSAAQDAVALIMAMGLHEDSDIALAIADILIGRPADDIADVALQCAGFAAATLHAIDALTDGAGTTQLQRLALDLADPDAPPEEP